MTTSYPSFLAYFSISRGLLVISANKCASTFLNENLVDKKGFSLLNVGKMHNSSKEAVNNSSLSKKVFIYRDPIDRFIGWYSRFIYIPYVKPLFYRQSYKTLYDTATKHISYKRDLIENAHYFLSQYSEEQREELLKWDTHTVPLYTYFEYVEGSVDDYHILNMHDLHQLMSVNFGEAHVSYTSKMIQISTHNIKLLNEIAEMLFPIYQKDYEMLYPKLRPYDE